MGHKSDTTDIRLGEIAARQHGVVSLRQLEELGLGRYAVAKRAKKGRLHRIHQGVYTVGHKGLSWHGRWMAAVLACGEGAVLSHGSAAALWNLLKPTEGPIHVSTPSTSGRSRRRGIHVHRTPSLRTPSLTEPSPSPSYLPEAGGRRGRLLSPNVTYRANIPTTTVERSIEDLRASSLIPPHLIRRAIRQAELKGYRLGNVETNRTRSDLEALFLALLEHYGLPRPEVNVRLGRWEVDFLWRVERLVVETDFWGYHRGSVAFHADLERDLDLRAAGYAVRRFTDRQLEAEPGRVAGDVARALSQEVSHLSPG
ncbi:MAG TPA: type IV toxin-antitoxin system AbiEi family antitoxin domain-containing protein [Solirubrobacterales bacterium]|nr:type IV toxin-antitoxin system AbiEi family antitoxin domain-containing protein [Solirubrobacterales bacterium]